MVEVKGDQLRCLRCKALIQYTRIKGVVVIAMLWGQLIPLVEAEAQVKSTADIGITHLSS